MTAATVLEAHSFPKALQELTETDKMPLLAETIRILDPFNENSTLFRTKKLLQLIREIKFLD